MRRCILLWAAVLSLFVLQACAGINLTYKDESAAAVTAALNSAVSGAMPPASPGGGQTVPETAAADAAEIPPAEPADTRPAVVSSAESPQKDRGEQPPLLTAAVEDAGVSFDDLAFSQLVLVAAEGAGANVYCYDKGDGGQWKLNKTIGGLEGFVGRNGVSFSKLEGDLCTPGGLFKLGFAFGNSEEPETAMVFRPVTGESYWVDDPNSKYYNQWVEGKEGADWSSAEHLSDSKKYYAYAVVVEYNMPDAVPGKGSAIFLHCKTEPTTGCVAVSEDSMLKILDWLDPVKDPNILIVSR